MGGRRRKAEPCPPQHRLQAGGRPVDGGQHLPVAIVGRDFVVQEGPLHDHALHPQGAENVVRIGAGQSCGSNRRRQVAS